MNDVFSTKTVLFETKRKDKPVETFAKPENEQPLTTLLPVREVSAMAYKGALAAVRDTFWVLKPMDVAWMTAPAELELKMFKFWIDAVPGKELFTAAQTNAPLPLSRMLVVLILSPKTLIERLKVEDREKFPGPM